MEQTNTTNIDTENNVYLTDSENKYLLDKIGAYLITNDKKENEIMPNTKKYVSLSKLTKYDELLKAKMAADDAKVLSDAKSFAEGLADNYEAAGTVNTAKQELQKNIDALANGAVAQNTAAIAKLNGDVNTDGSVDKKIAASAASLQAGIDAVDSIADANAADIVTMKGQIDALEKGTYDDTEVRGLISANADAIGALEETHATDKGTLEGAIALKADQTALDAVSEVANAAVKQTDYNTKVAALEAEDARIAGLVTDETTARAAADEAMDARLVKVETFFKTADGETLDTALDTLVEIQKYITEDGSAADQMVQDIAANAKAIEDEVKARGEADAALQGAIDLKADASVVETLSGKVTNLETASATHATKDEVTAVSDALNEYKNAHKDDYTNTQVDEKIKAVADDVAALNDTYASDAELTAAIEGEVTRANGAYAAKAYETTVDGHISNTTVHITADERTMWNGALHATDIVTGTANGTIAVKGTDVAVKGLGSAAYAETSAFDAAGAASAVDTKLTAEVDRATAKEAELQNAINAFVEVSEEEINALFA